MQRAAWVTLPENRAAWCAAEQVACWVCGRSDRAAVNPLFLHGPAGTGKTLLVSLLTAEVAEQAPDSRLALLGARELGALFGADGEASEDLSAARQADLLVVEDLQHLPARAVPGFVGLVDRCLARRRQLVCTALAGPAQLTDLPARLTSRLAQGVIVGLEPLGPASRLAFLQERARQRGLEVAGDVLAWLAEHIPGSARQLEGALTALAGLARLHGRAPALAEVVEHFREPGAGRPTVERIAQGVGRYFRVDPQQLRSRRRSRAVLLPRQVGMYLTRQLTELSLAQIGAYFGGRDHSTVLHACRKVEQALTQDAPNSALIAGAVRRLQADLA
jgi:chromosomal replication initiator protein